MRAATLALLGLVAAVPYLAAPANELVWDDRLHLLDNPGTAGVLGALARFAVPEGVYYRPLVFLSFGAENAVWPGSALGFHLTNVLLHAMDTGLVFAVAVRSRVTAGAAFVAAAFFAVHPLQVEAVAYVSGRTDLLMTAAALAAMWLCLAPQEGSRLLRRGIAAAVATAAALLCKETGYAVAPLVACLVWRHGARGARLAKLALPSVLVAIALLALRPAALPVLARVSVVSTLAAIGATTAEYARLVVWPAALQVDRLTAAPAPGGEALGYAALGTALVLAVLYLLMRLGAAGDWVAWSAALYLPVSNALPLYPQIAARALFTPEHNLYAPLAGVGVLLALAGSAALLHLPRSGRRLALAAAAAALVLLANRTSARVNDWHDESTLFGSAAAVGSLSPRVWYNLGNSLMSMAPDRPKAIAAYREGVRLAPGDAALWLNLGVALQVEKQLEEARAAYERAIELSPSALAYENLGTLDVARGDMEAARAAFAAALRLDPTRAKAWQALSAMGGS